MSVSGLKSKNNIILLWVYTKEQVLNPHDDYSICILSNFGI